MKFIYSAQPDIFKNIDGSLRLLDNDNYVARVGFYAKRDGVIDLAQDNSAVLHVDPSRRREGLGKMICGKAISQAITELKQRGIQAKKVKASTTQLNIPAQKLLESMGYVGVENSDPIDETIHYEFNL